MLTNGETVEFSIQRVCNAFSNGCFANSRRSNETKNYTQITKARSMISEDDQKKKWNQAINAEMTYFFQRQILSAFPRQWTPRSASSRHLSTNTNAKRPQLVCPPQSEVGIGIIAYRAHNGLFQALWMPFWCSAHRWWTYPTESQWASPDRTYKDTIHNTVRKRDHITIE